MIPRRPTPASWTTAAGPRRRRKNIERGYASIPAPPTARWRNAGDDAGRRGRIGRSRSSRRSRGSCRAPTPPWWTRSRDAGLAEFFVAVLTPFPPPPVYLITHYQRSLAAGARGTFDAGSRSRAHSRGSSGWSRTAIARRARGLGQKAENPHPPISRPAKLDATGSPQPAGGRTAHKYTALFSASSEQRKTRAGTKLSEIHSQSALCQVAARQRPRTREPHR